MSSFEISLRFFQKLTGIKKIHLSLSRYTLLGKKEVTGKSHTKTGRITPFEHLQRLVSERRIKDLEKPLMILSVRNVLSNLRCVAYIKGYTKDGLARVAEENVHTERPYHILAEKNSGTLTIEEFDSKNGNKADFFWFLSGVPVLWNEGNEKELLERIVTEAADHSHVWHIPRGNHPEATNKTRKQWQDLQDIFIETLPNTRYEAFRKLQAYAKENKLKREDNILHNILGVDDSGKLYQLTANGRLEELGRQIKEQGAKKAICVDNSGSTVVQFYPKGVNGECKQLVAAPNYRAPGTAYLVIELRDDAFTFLS